MIDDSSYLNGKKDGERSHFSAILPPSPFIDRTFGFPEYGHKVNLGVRSFL
jgi:hypothetical protein